MMQIDERKTVRTLLLSATAIALFTACKKSPAPTSAQDEPKQPVNLTMPNSGTNEKSSGLHRLIETPSPEGQRPIPAEVEVKASSGPIELTLGLYQTKISGAYPWFRLRLRNTGRNKIRVLSEPFTNSYVIQEKRGENTTGIYLEILNSAGKSPIVNMRGPSDADPALRPPILTDKERAQIDRWTKEGLGGEEVDRRAAELIRQNHPTEYAEPSAFWMEPGASTETLAFADEKGAHAGKRIGDFAELSNYYLPPGKYRIRAVYDLYSDPEYYKKNHISVDDWEVRVKTPYIDFEILP